MRISDWSSDVCSSDLGDAGHHGGDGEGDDLIGCRIIAQEPHPVRAVARCAQQLAEAQGEQPAQAEEAAHHEGERYEVDRDRHRIVVEVEAEQHVIVGQAVEAAGRRSEEHTSELQSLMRISYAVFCLKKKNKTKKA